MKKGRPHGRWRSREGGGLEVTTATSYSDWNSSELGPDVPVKWGD